ncbi:uncharacterized protein CBL_08040 [Carabus blaptoides fortunei]
MVHIFQRLQFGSIVMILSQLLAFLFPVTFAVDPDCNYSQMMTPLVNYYVYNSEYPGFYRPSQNCRWVAVAPANHKIDISCQIEMPQSTSCSMDRLLISLTGNPNLENAHIYCGSGNTTLQSEYNNVTIGLVTAYNTPGGRFLCTIRARPAQPSACDCGWKQNRRIVGGVETKVNEYPMMAAVIDFAIRELICGATIISTRYAMSAAHCFRNLAAPQVGLLVGEHDISTGTETNATRLYTVQQIRKHENYNPNNGDSPNDIALIKTMDTIVFSMNVGPACLPFRFVANSFAGDTVEALGWGTTDFTGPKSEVLLKTNLSVLTEVDCYNQVAGSLTQMCTYTSGHDACQSDSGGPLLWLNYDNIRMYAVGIISSGIGCGGRTPGINTRVTSFLLWIMANSAGSYVVILVQILSFLLPISLAIDADCNYFANMTPGPTYYIYNSEYPNYYRPGKICRWVAIAPEGYKINVTCQIDMPQTPRCNQDRLLISLTGDLQLQNANSHCGYGNLTLQTEYNNITIGLLSAYYTPGGRFLCSLNTIKVTPPIPSCDCGWKQLTRIVGGEETKVNEYPMMAGVIDFEIRDLICGATIISSCYLLSAAHCHRHLPANLTGVVVGEHNISSGVDTNSTRIHLVELIITHPKFNFSSSNPTYDISVIKTVTHILFNTDVGPACLPFRYYKDLFINQTVEMLGWGTTEFTGPKSEVLLKTNVTVLSPTDCKEKMNGTLRQMCTYAPGHDACQSDSGGPLVWHNAGSERLYLVGIISSGIGCGGKVPGINTRITPFLKWILANTIDADYCVK